MSAEERLVRYENINTAQSASQLLNDQKNSWEQCRKGYSSLDEVQVKTFEFDGYNIYVQFNPGRLTSSSAKVDPKSIKERKCFLCMENLPEGQKGILYNDHYIILCNPFPIFPEHFTIPAIKHTPQRILPYFSDFLKLTRGVSEKYLVFYNGPKCGASAPDHFHFQAGTKNFIPLVSGFSELKSRYASNIYSGKTKVYHIEDGLRRLLIIEGTDPSGIEKSFSIIYNTFAEISPGEDEPLMNVISIYDKDLWRVIIILREKHRPARYFEEGERNILLSPASVDLSGVCITPLEKDFNKISKDDLIGIFNEVNLNTDKFSGLIKGLNGKF